MSAILKLYNEKPFWSAGDIIHGRVLFTQSKSNLIMAFWIEMKIEEIFKFSSNNRSLMVGKNGGIPATSLHRNIDLYHSYYRVRVNLLEDPYTRQPNKVTMPAGTTEIPFSFKIPCTPEIARLATFQTIAARSVAHQLNCTISVEIQREGTFTSDVTEEFPLQLMPLTGGMTPLYRSLISATESLPLTKCGCCKGGGFADITIEGCPVGMFPTLPFPVAVKVRNYSSRAIISLKLSLTETIYIAQKNTSTNLLDLFAVKADWIPDQIIDSQTSIKTVVLEPFKFDKNQYRSYLTKRCQFATSQSALSQTFYHLHAVVKFKGGYEISLDVPIFLMSYGPDYQMTGEQQHLANSLLFDAPIKS